jgi:hypothetical protein
MTTSINLQVKPALMTPSINLQVKPALMTTSIILQVIPSSDAISMPSISLTNFCHIEDFLTKKNPNYEWYSGRLLNNKLTDIPREKLTISK